MGQAVAGVFESGGEADVDEFNQEEEDGLNNKYEPGKPSSKKKSLLV